MHQISFFPLGNADSYRVDLASGKKLLFDYAQTLDFANTSDKRIDLSSALHEDLAQAGRDFFDVVAFTHADDDHVCGMSDFFYLEHASKYQDDARVRIDELWVPAAVIVETGLSGDARVLQAEARYRLKLGEGIRVFSRPGPLEEWATENGIDLDDRLDLLVDAGQLVPGFDKGVDGVEFFVHSPFAERLEDGSLFERNECSLVLQATFLLGGAESRFLLSADTTWDNFASIVDISRFHENDERLAWDIFKLPHHCSYLSLSPEKDADTTDPVDQMKWLIEQQGAERGLVISTSDPIPSVDTDQPPHRQAANYYKKELAAKQGQFLVTMEHPSAESPEPLIITIDQMGPTVRRTFAAPTTVITSHRAPRAGCARA